MLILLSPSKALNFEDNTNEKHSNCEFLEESEKLIQQLRELSKEEISSLMKLSKNLTELNFARYKNFKTPFTKNNAKQAAFAFKGDVYDGLDFESLDSETVEYAQNNLRILSGLYGLLKPLDLIQPYRLEMGTRLKNNKGRNLYEFWGDKITDKINSQEKDLIINLASNEYFKAINKKKVQAKIISPVFKEYKNGEYKIVMLYAKRARGAMARYIIENKVDNSDSLKEFNLNDYSYSAKLSKENEPVFIR